MKYLCWFSCGAASAVASKIMVERYENVELVYINPGSEHPDNMRFIHDCEEWIGKEIKILSSGKYKDTWDVYDQTGYLVGVYGARCSLELKKRVRQEYEDLENDIQIFGFTFEEKERAKRFNKNNPEIRTKFPLIENKVTKSVCLALIERNGIELPKMYKLGYSNNNCIGCVKGGQGYWNKIRKDFPEVFDRMAKQERKMDVAINKRTEVTLDDETGEKYDKRIRVFLDELPEDSGRYDEIKIQCDLFCDNILEDEK